MKEQEIYKNVLKRLIDQTEKLQIKNTEEMIQTIIRELEYYELPKAQKQLVLNKMTAK
ncbi:hypothetical protein NC797_01075 [Aquibacillus sp. 3ASR75-11]|uniref:Uncharacterized protein n=1 Tax=Terrihalobacillus insolitus TaxID=2950438 RepID=A0A9X4AM28_9BACI|nr:hypothetical protein [Terrihalobacillus insolitus]MDC3412208.1 hypothetical protein [Terrihalobacillus insolitus]MDC3423098.1 hypothetical protein [Terrihalobacillus insolitus]